MDAHEEDFTGEEIVTGFLKSYHCSYMSVVLCDMVSRGEIRVEWIKGLRCLMSKRKKATEKLAILHVSSMKYTLAVYTYFSLMRALIRGTGCQPQT